MSKDEKIAELEASNARWKEAYNYQLTRINHLGVEIDGALRGRLPEKSCQMERLQMIAALSQKVEKLRQELSRYSVSAGQADQRMAESIAARKALGFSPYAEDVAPADLLAGIIEARAQAVESFVLELSKRIDRNETYFGFQVLDAVNSYADRARKEVV